MQKPSQNDLSLQWPLYAQKQSSHKKKFWQKDKKPLGSNQWLIMEGDLMRISKKKTKPKSYYFRLTTEFILYYYKKQSDSVPKGKLQLDEYTQINIQQILVGKLKDGQKPIAISIITYDQDQFQLFHQQGPAIFGWWSTLVRVCTINNFDDMYYPMEVLGKGSFATVYKVKRLLDSEFMAAKYYYKDQYLMNPHKEKLKKMIHNEQQILRQISHSGIIELHEMYQQPDKIVLIMEYVPGKDLYQLIKDNERISERKASIIINNIAESLLSLTTAGYVHRDLKLENILVGNLKTLQTKLVDFGFAEPINRFSLLSKAGTPGYIAPEVFQNKPYEESGDMFSLGIILFSMVGGYSPFKGKTYAKIMQENKDAVILFEKAIWREISPECQLLIKAMTSPDPRDRITFKNILTNKWLSAEFHQSRINSKQSQKDLKQNEDIANEYRSRADSQVPKSFYMSSNKTIKSIHSIHSSAHSQQSQFSQQSKQSKTSIRTPDIIQRYDVDQPKQRAVSFNYKEVSFKSNQDTFNQVQIPFVLSSMEKKFDTLFDLEPHMMNDIEEINTIGKSNIQFVRSGNVIFNQPKFNIMSKQKKKKDY